MVFSSELIEQIQEESDIVDVIGSYVHLQKKGAQYFGVCPFHNEKTPSFSVAPQKRMFYCFGCGAGGNVFSFIMKYENCSFQEAVKMLAERRGIKLPDVEMSEEQKKAASLREKLLEVNKEAAKFYHQMLKSPEGAVAYKYFSEKRGLSDKTIVHFGLGYSGKSGTSLYRYLKEKGYKDQILRETGLFTYSERGVTDKFWNRAMFPIMDIQNRVIGFGGRVMGEGEPKYLNSPETKIFDKGRNLFGLNFAKTDRRPYVLICEGYMDVISLQQAGYVNAVASLGTALTSLQAHLLSRYTKDVYLTYDSDGAGVKAALRAIPIFRGEGVSLHVVNMQPYKDPDEFIKNLGAEEYEKRIQNAQSSFSFELSVIEKKYNFSEPEQKNKFFEEVLKNIVTTYEDTLERQNFVEAVASRYNVSISALEEKIRKIGMSNLTMEGRMISAEEALEAREERKLKNSVRKNASSEVPIEEKHLLTWIGNDKNVCKKIEGIIEPDDFTEGICRQVAELAFEQYKANGEVQPECILNNFESPEERDLVAEIFQTEILLEMDESAKQKALFDTARKIKLTSVDRQLKVASAANDMNRFMELSKSKNNLTRSFKLNA